MTPLDQIRLFAANVAGRKAAHGESMKGTDIDRLIEAYEKVRAAYRFERCFYPPVNQDDAAEEYKRLQQACAEADAAIEELEGK
jgi:hypothetical protein